MSLAAYIIAKDEEELLPNLLDSIERAFDHIVLCDTGSTDQTRPIFSRWLADTGQSGTMCRFEWCDDFGTARQFAMEEAEKYADWVCWLDCDEVVENAGDLRYVAQVYQGYNGISFPYWPSAGVLTQRTRLTRAGKSEWKGRAHECHTVDPVMHCPDVTFRQTRDGGRYLERDLRCLREDLAEDPMNTRAAFYLAQTLKDLGRYDEAVDAYRKRAIMGGWHQEVYLSVWFAGAQTGCIEELYNAITIDPRRAEAMWSLSHWLRQAGSIDEADAWDKVRRQLPGPPEDALFAGLWAYGHQS